MTELDTRDLTVEEAREFVEQVRASVQDIKEWIVRAVKGRAWLALGYASWDEMCEAEFDGAVIRLPREDRREVVSSLREAGLSTRAIGSALGVDHKTVVNDIQSTGEFSPVGPGKVTSLDGRQRPATQPVRPSPSAADQNVQRAAALILHRAGYEPVWIADHLGGTQVPADTTAVTPELLDAAAAYVRDLGITYYGVGDAVEKIREELAAAGADPPAPAAIPKPTPEPAPEPGLWFGGPELPTGQDRADAAVTQAEQYAAARPVPPKPAPVMLTLRTHTGEEVPYPKPQAKPTFNLSPGGGISWAQWSWNPVTGCLHGCGYCYARAIINRYADANPAGFTPLFHEERLDAPANTVIPAVHADDSHPGCTDGECMICAYRRVFVCSMADLYGRWVPDDWIDQVHAAMLASPAWQFILLTKFPARYVGLDLPSGAWVGTSVDEQKRVRIAEDAFRNIDGAAVKWLSLEPLLEPLEFTDLSMFNWVVIGAQTQTVQPDGPVPAFAPPIEWVARIITQAKDAGCKVHLKPNLRTGPGMQWLDEYPGA